MIPSRPTLGFLCLAAIATVCLSPAAAAPAAAGPRAYALVGGRTLLPFDVDNPQIVGTPIPITGLRPGETLVGIDFRPQNGHLYGLAVEGTTRFYFTRLYDISVRTGTATAVGPGEEVFDITLPVNVPISETSFGVDFDPLEDRLRVVNNALRGGHNFRYNPNDGTPADSNPSTPEKEMDGVINGQVSSIDAAAYDNSRQTASFRTLYTLSAVSNTLNIQSSPNSGTQTAATPITVNGLSLDFVGVNGFDILPGVWGNLFNGVDYPTGPPTGLALLSLGPADAPGLYKINLQNGAAMFVGALGGGIMSPVRGLAVQGDQERPGGLPAVAVDAAGRLLRFNTGRLDLVRVTPVTGLAAGETLVGIDWRPQTGQLFGLAKESAGLARLYRLDPQTGVATVVGNGALALVLDSSRTAGFDFDPATDLVRVVTAEGYNYWMEPNIPAIRLSTKSLNGLPAGSTGVSAAAYTNSFGQPLDGTAPTTLYTLDATSNQLFIQSPPDSGTQTRGVPVTLDGSPLDFTDVNGFDIPAAVRVDTADAPATGHGYATLTVSGTSQLYALELSTGAATLIGPVAAETLHALALGDGPPASRLTLVALSSSANPMAADQPVTFTATIAPATATGTVAFAANATNITGCDAQPITAGTATCTTTAATFTSFGTFAIAAVYGGDDLHLSSTGTLSQVVTPLAAITTTTVTAAPAIAVAGRTVRLTATVAPAVPEPATGPATGPPTGPPTGTVTFFVDSVLARTMPLTNSGEATFSTSSLPAGVHEIAARYSGDATFAASAAAPFVVTIAAPGPLTQYFAEGAGGFFHTVIGILNASETDTAHVTVWLYPEGGAPVERLMTLAPLGRKTFDLDTVVDHVAGVSALVSSDQPIAATRQMTWGDPVYGSTLESGIPSTSPTWYFAEGATNTFSLFYLIQNPGATEAIVTLTHLLEGGAAPIAHQEIVPPFSRRTVFVNDVPGLAAAAVSTAIIANVPIVAERAMYLNGTSRLFEGGTASRGATALSPTWSFAEGATGFFHTYLLFGNPDAQSATVTVQYQLPDGATIARAYDVAGQSRRTVDVNAEDPQLASTAVSMIVTATRPIVAERAMWWGLPMWNEGSAALGSTETGFVWGIGEGAEAAGPIGEGTFVLVANASATPGAVRFTVSYDDGTLQQKEYALLGNARLTVRIGDDFASTRGQTFSVLVESLTDGMPIAVDVSRYQSADGFLGAGGAASATKIIR